MYVCMYVCMYVRVCVYIYIWMPFVSFKVIFLYGRYWVLMAPFQFFGIHLRHSPHKSSSTEQLI